MTNPLSNPFWYDPASKFQLGIYIFEQLEVIHTVLSKQRNSALLATPCGILMAVKRAYLPYVINTVVVQNPRVLSMTLLLSVKLCPASGKLLSLRNCVALA